MASHAITHSLIHMLCFPLFLFFIFLGMDGIGTVASCPSEKKVAYILPKISSTLPDCFQHTMRRPILYLNPRGEIVSTTFVWEDSCSSQLPLVPSARTAAWPKIDSGILLMRWYVTPSTPLRPGLDGDRSPIDRDSIEHQSMMLPRCPSRRTRRSNGFLFPLPYSTDNTSSCHNSIHLSQSRPRFSLSTFRPSPVDFFPHPTWSIQLITSGETKKKKKRKK